MGWPWDTVVGARAGDWGSAGPAVRPLCQGGPREPSCTRGIRFRGATPAQCAVPGPQGCWRRVPRAPSQRCLPLSLQPPPPAQGSGPRCSLWDLPTSLEDAPTRDACPPAAQPPPMPRLAGPCTHSLSWRQVPGGLGQSLLPLPFPRLPQKSFPCGALALRRSPRSRHVPCSVPGQTRTACPHALRERGRIGGAAVLTQSAPCGCRARLCGSRRAVLMLVLWLLAVLTSPPAVKPGAGSRARPLQPSLPAAWAGARP